MGYPKGPTPLQSVFSVCLSIRPFVRLLQEFVTENTCMFLLQKILPCSVTENTYFDLLQKPIVTTKNPVTDRWTNPSTPLLSLRGIKSILEPKHLLKLDTMNLHLVRCLYVNNKTQREITATPEASFNDHNPSQGTMNGRGH